MSFANLKRSRGTIDRLTAAAQASQSQSKSYVDERMWKPTVDKQNNVYAIIRFLPANEGSDLPWAKYWDHAFKGPTAKIMMELGFAVSTLTVAQHYADILDGIVIDPADRELSGAIEDLGIKGRITDTNMVNEHDKRRLAAEVISFSETIAT